MHTKVDQKSCRGIPKKKKKRETKMSEFVLSNSKYMNKNSLQIDNNFPGASHQYDKRVQITYYGSMFSIQVALPPICQEITGHISSRHRQILGRIANTFSSLSSYCVVWYTITLRNSQSNWLWSFCSMMLSTKCTLWRMTETRRRIKKERLSLKLLPKWRRHLQSQSQYMILHQIRVSTVFESIRFRYIDTRPCMCVKCECVCVQLIRFCRKMWSLTQMLVRHIPISHHPTNL